MAVTISTHFNSKLREDLQKEQKQLEQDIAAKKAQLEQLQGELQEHSEQAEQLRAQIRQAESRLSDLKAKAKAAEARLAEAQKQAEEAEKLQAIAEDLRRGNPPAPPFSDNKKSPEWSGGLFFYSENLLKFA